MKLGRKVKGAGTAFILFTSIGLMLCVLEAAIFKQHSLITIASDVQTDVILANSSVYKCVDLKSLGEDDPKVIVKDYTAALNEMKKHLMVNMDLDENLKPKVDGVIKGNIIIEEFTIYNFKGTSVDIITYKDGSFIFNTKDITSKKLFTSNNYEVTSTMVTTTIAFNVENMFGRVEPQIVSVDTDIVSK